jgi:nitrogen regulatory protein P-II 1
MKQIEAVIRPHKLDAVREALIDNGITGMTIEEVRGFGRQKGHTQMYRGSEYHVNFMPKIKLVMVVVDSLVDRIVSTITQTAKTGTIGDGKIFITPVEEVVRVRTEESGECAL